jgi:hypothetical protein
MTFLSNPRFLAVYSGALTAIFAITALSGFASPKNARFDEISVQRIDVVEPDGTIRMILSNRAHSPGLILHRKEYPHPTRKTAGMIFFDDEGTESGGLIFGGKKDPNGKVSRSGHLSFDQYDQDQIFSIDASEDNGRRQSGITISDRGDYPVMEALEAVMRIAKLPAADQAAERAKFRASHPGDAPRAYLGRATDRSVGLRLMDDKGRERLRVRVNADGSPVIQFLDADGKVTSQVPEAR